MLLLVLTSLSPLCVRVGVARLPLLYSLSLLWERAGQASAPLPLPVAGEGLGEGDRSSALAGCGVLVLKAEKCLWQKLRARQLGGVKFRKEPPVGTYIVDFVSFEHKLAVEIDGGQHNAFAGRQHDIKRTAWLETQGFRMLRFWNNQVLASFEGVLERTLSGT